MEIGKGSASASLPSIRPVKKKVFSSNCPRATVCATWGRTERPSVKKVVLRWGMNLGWFCMSWRQPAQASAAMLRTKSREQPLAARIRFMGLILLLHHRSRAEALQEAARFHHLELGIVCLQAKKEFVHGRPGTKIGSIEEWVIKRRQATHSEHAESGRETRPQDGPLISRDDEGRPGKERTPGDVQRIREDRYPGLHQEHGSQPHEPTDKADQRHVVAMETDRFCRLFHRVRGVT